MTSIIEILKLFDLNDLVQLLT